MNILINTFLLQSEKWEHFEKNKHFFKIQSVKWFIHLYKKLHWIDCQILIMQKRVKGIYCMVVDGK